MKKYIAHWSLFNLLSASQEEVVKLQMMWAAISGILLSSTFVMSSDRITLISALACAIVDKVIIGCFYFEEKK
jgi:hypothetical protein